MPHTVVLPIELYPPLDSIEFYILHYPRKKKKFFCPQAIYLDREKYTLFRYIFVRKQANYYLFKNTVFLQCIMLE